MSANLQSRLEHLESLVKLWDGQLAELGVQLRNCDLKLNLITGWISKRFGVGFPEHCGESMQKKSNICRSNICQQNDDNALHANYTRLPLPFQNTTFHQRFRQIKESIRKRRYSSISQESVSRRYPYIRTPSTTFSFPSEVDNSKTFSEHHKQDPTDETVVNPIRVSGVITHTNVIKCGESSTHLLLTEKENTNLATDKTRSTSNNSEIPAKPEETSTSKPQTDRSPSQKRGRPKKRPDPVSSSHTHKISTPLICDECGKVCKGPSSLRSHKLSHSNLRPFKCSLCPKMFKQKHHLDFHRLTHDDTEKKWTCRYCTRGFIAQRDLLRHERTHTGEKPFPCTYKDCSKSFNVKQHLTLHIRTHTGERPYRCLICDKTFTQANSLRIHKKIHAKE